MSLRTKTFFLFLLLPLCVGASGLSLPIGVVSKPATDLLSPSSSKGLNTNEIISLERDGFDISLLNPSDNKLWQNQSYSASNAHKYSYPQPGPASVTTVTFVAHESENKFTYMARVKKGSRYFRFSLSRYAHTTLLRANLLRKLGYFVPSPKFYSDITVKFSSVDQMEQFMKHAQEATSSDFVSRKWFKKIDKEGFQVTFSNALLEPTSANYFDIHWAFVPKPENPKHRGFIRQLSKNRAFRALIIPLVLADLPESINRFSPKIGSIYANNVLFNHPSSSSFFACNYSDAKWIVRKILRLSSQDWREIIQHSHLPKEINEIVYRKILYRVRNLSELFNLKKDFQNQHTSSLPRLKWDSPSGLILKGKVTQEFIDGYPQRFSHGDRESPFSSDDIFRYISIEAASSGLGEILNKVNKNLSIVSHQDLAQKRQKVIQQRIHDHIQKNPLTSLFQKVESWGGVVAGGSVDASRHVATGTYYDSHAAIQLVDHLTVNTNIGYFRGLDGYAKVFPSAGGNLQLQRSYTHVRPINTLEEGKKVPWENVFIPGFLNNLIKDLDKPSTDATSQENSLNSFLNQLKDGEVFTISDSVALTGYLQVASSIDVLLGMKPFRYTNAISLGTDASLVVLKQTHFLKTKDGLQIFIRSINNKAAGISFDANYFINLIRLRASTTRSKTAIDAYIIPYSTEISSLIEDKTKKQELTNKQEHLQIALSALFKENDHELLQKYFSDKKFKINHELFTKKTSSKFFLEHRRSFYEEHDLHLKYPENKDYPHLKAEDEKVHIFSSRQGKLVGYDILNLFADFFNQFIDKPGALSFAQSPNPANLAFGKAHWKTISVEADLSSSKDSYPSVGKIQKIWGGWKIDRPEFLELIQNASKDLLDSENNSYRLLEEEAFNDVNSVEFYRVTSNFSIFEDGLNKIRDLMLQIEYKDLDKNSSSQTQGFSLGSVVSNLFSKLSFSSEKYLASDKFFYEAILKMFAYGDVALGQKHYVQICQQEVADSGVEDWRLQDDNYTGSASEVMTSASYYGQSYECISPWLKSLLYLRRHFPQNKKEQVKWLAKVLPLLEEHIPLPQLLAYIGKENYLFFIQISGFRTGDEDGDLQFFSNSIGDPKGDFETANGLISLYASKTGVVPGELYKTNADFQ